MTDLERLKSEAPITQRRAAENMMKGNGVMRGDLARVIAEIQQTKAEEKKLEQRKARRRAAKRSRRANR